MAKRSLFTTALLALGATALMAGGEYERFHIGPQIGVAVSMSKEYRGYLNPLPDGSGNLIAINGNGMLSPTLGLGMTYSFHPSSFRLGLDVEFLRPIDKDNSEGIVTDKKKVEIPGIIVNTKVAQNVYRATLKSIFSFHPNTYAGWYFWLGPSIAKVDTSVQVVVDELLMDLPAKKVMLHGGGLGLGRRSLRDTRMGIFEINLHYLKDSSDGIQAGGLTFEIKGGIHF
jgi:hypothetical protein